MQRRALVVGNAGGQDDSLNAVLQRFGFAPAVSVQSAAVAAARLRDEPVHLVIVPLDSTDPVDLATLDREVRRSDNTSIIGTATLANPDLILRAMRSGVHEFLVHPPDPKELAAAVDRLLRRGRSDGAGGGTTIAVFSPKGGVGTSTVAVNLAFALARVNPEGRVCVADFVVSGGDVGVLLNLKPSYDIGDLVAKVDRLDADLLYSLLAPASAGVWALASGDRPEALEAVDGGAASAILQKLRQHFAFTVVDCESHLSDRTLAALDAADRVLVVTQLNVPALRSTQRSLALFRRLGYADEKVTVVLNRYDSGGGLISLGDAEKLLDREIAVRLPNDYKSAAAAVNLGKPVVESAGASALAKSFSALATKLGGVATANGTGGAKGARLTSLFGFGRK